MNNMHIIIKYKYIKQNKIYKKKKKYMLKHNVIKLTKNKITI